jgi:ketosteroid isomerase-like protein
MRRHGVFLLVAAAATGLLAGCMTTGQSGTDADVAAIRQIWVEYSTAVVKGDSATWLSLWDAGGIQLRSDAPQRSKADLDAQVPGAFKARAGANDVAMVVSPEEITVAGPWAYSHGQYTQDLKNKSTGVVTHVDGKFLTILKRQADGTWRLYRDCFNSNVAPK